MAESAALLLKVGLDLNHFRRELSRASSELAGQPITVGIKIDRSKIVSEFQLLNRYLGNKTFRATIETNLSAEIDKARKLAEALKNIPAGGGASGAIGIIEKGFAQKAYKAISPENIKKLYRAAADAGLLAFNETIANNKERIIKELANVGQSSIAGLLNGLTSGDAKIRDAAASLGKILIATIKSELGIASPSKETGKLGKFAAEGFENGFVTGMVRAERNMARAIRSAVIGAIKDGLGNLPGMGGALVSFERQLAASVQLAVRKAMREGMKSSVLPGAKGALLGGTGGAATGAVVGGAKALGGGVAGGVAKLTAGGVLGTAANLARYSIDNSAYQEFVGKLYQEIINSALGSGSQGAIVGALAVGGIAGGIGFAKGAAGSLAVQAVTAIRNRILAALLAVPTGGLNNIVEVMVRDITSAIFQKTIRQLRAANAQLPKIDWPAVTPPSGAAATPRTMALPEGRAFAALPGSTFGAQKRLIGDILDPSLKEILRNAANAFVDAVRQGMTSAVRSVNVRDLGTAARPMLSGGRVAGLLSAGVGRMPSPYATSGAGGGVESRADMIARREREARRRSDLRAMDVLGGGGGRTPSPYSYVYRPTSSAIVPYAPGGAMVPSGRGGGTGGGGGFPPGGGGNFRGIGGPGGGAGGALPTLNLPGSGVIRELGQEFAFATKQVLLFGQAYKLLAFIQDFPGQVGQAVGQLQSFRNTLKAISPSAAEAAKSNEFILDTVDRYNIPIQSARDGFTKLYASMEPAGFRGEEIRGLFKSISMGAATFGMSADKVDRVIYAFSQMASKGQVMSEELKGQLGDVLPGSMALFAEAAGFKGPDAISKFSAALEDGVYKGKNMVKLLKNVRIEMEQKFGPGAEGAARTFQGGIDRMQNSLRQLYQAFEPVAVNFMNQVVKPVTDGLRTAADGFTAFLQGVAAKTPQGAAFAQELERLRPALEGIGNNLKGLLPTFELFGNILLNVGKVLLAIAGNPITGFLLKVYANVLLVNTVFSLLGGKVLIGLISNIGAAIARFIALNVQMGLLQKTTAVANSSLAGTQLQMALLTRNAGAALGPVGLLKTALMGLARIGLIAIAIQVAIDGMAEIDRLKKSLDDIAGFSSKEYKKQVQGLSREEVNSRIIVNRRSQAQARKDLQAFAGPVGAARGLITGRDEELRARLVKYQIQEAVLQGARGNKTQSQLMRSRLGGALEPITGGGESGTKDSTKGAADKAAKEAAQLAEEIKRQAMAASDALFAEQQRLVILQQTNPIAKAFAEYTSKDLTIQRELNKALAEAKSEKEKGDRRETARLQQSANALELEQAMKSVREDAVRSVEDLLKGQREQLQYEEDVKQLLTEGMLPERARQVAEVRKLIRTQLDALDLSIQQAEAALKERESREGSTDAVKKLREELEKLKKARGDVADRGKQAEAGVPAPTETTKSPMDYIKDAAGAAQEELNKLTNWGYQAAQGANAVGSAFGKAFADIASGAQSADQALATAFQSIASHFFDMAAQIITQMITMYILKTLLGMFGGGGGFSSGGGGFSSGAAGFGGSFDAGIAPLSGITDFSEAFKFAEGGFVTGPTQALIGEAGESEYVIPASKMRGAMARYSAGARGNAVIPADGGEGISSMSMGAPVSLIDVRYSVERINSVDYVTADQFRAGMAQAAQQGATQGEQRTLRRLQQSRATRSRLGMN